MTRPTNLTILAWAAAGLLLAAGFFFVGVGCGDSGPSGSGQNRRITVTFRNDGDDNVHLLGPGESPIQTDPPAGNRLIPGATRSWTSAGTHRAGDQIQFRAIRAGSEVAPARNCPVTDAVVTGSATPAVVFDEPPGQVLCQGWL